MPQFPFLKSKFLLRLWERYYWTSLRNKIGLWCMVALLVIAVVSFQWVQPAYRTAKMWLYLGMADKAIQREDYNSAALAFRKALLSGMENPASWNALGGFLEKVGSPESINVWERLAKMEPKVAKYPYKQAEAALRFNRAFQAEEVLARMPAEWRTAPEGLRIQAEIDIRKKLFPAAEETLLRLLQQVPSDQKAAFDLLCLRAAKKDLNVREPARRELEAIAAGSSEVSATASRRLMEFAAEEGNMNEANRVAARLAASPYCTLQDRLYYAQTEAVTNSFTLPITLANLRAYAVKHATDFASIMQWFISTGLDPVGTARWVKELPPQVRSQPEVQSALFGYYLSTSDWNSVLGLLRDPDSPLYLPPAIMDLAQKALEMERTGVSEADNVWQEAVYAANGQPRSLRILSLLASARGWSSATGRALSALAESSPGEPSIWWLLVQHENATRNLPGLYRALDGLMRINPYDINVASNWVLAASLVRQGDTKALVDVAKRTYLATYPSDPQAATAYALALLTDDRAHDALGIIEQMTPAARREPNRVIYIGAVLAANGRKDEALESFARAENLSDKLFPEEKTLRAIWRGVAQGEATTAEEAEKLLIQRNDPDVAAVKLQAQLADQIRRRSDPAEVQRILESLKAESESRNKTPLMLDQLMQDVRKKPSP